MAELSSALFPIGVVFVALGFAASIGHAVMLANGRRTVSVSAPQLARQPAYAGVVTGSFVTAQARAQAGGTALGASASPRQPSSLPRSAGSAWQLPDCDSSAATRSHSSALRDAT